MAEKTKRILLVADHNAFREALAIRLNQEEDLEVAWQSGSIVDTRYIHLNGVDVAVVDPLLPDGDGLDLVRELSDGAGGRIPTLVLTAYLDNTVAARAMDAGAQGALSKVASVPEKVGAIKRLIEIASSEA